MIQEKSFSKIIEITEDGEKSKFLLCSLEDEESEVHLELLPISGNTECSYKTKFAKDDEILTSLANHLDESDPVKKVTELFKELKDALQREDCGEEFTFSINSDNFICDKNENFCGNVIDINYLTIPIQKTPCYPIVTKIVHNLTVKLKSCENELKKKIDPIEQVQECNQNIKKELEAIVKEHAESERNTMLKVMELLNNLKRKNSQLQKEIDNLNKQRPGTSKDMKTNRHNKYSGEQPSESSLELISDLELSAKNSYDDSLVIESIIVEKSPAEERIVIDDSSDSAGLIPKRLKTPSKPDGFMESLSEVIKNSPLKSAEKETQKPSTSKTPSNSNKRRIISETDSDPDIFSLATLNKEDENEEIPSSQLDSESIYSSAKRLRRKTPYKHSETPGRARRSLLSTMQKKATGDENKNIYEQDTEDLFGSFLQKIT